MVHNDDWCLIRLGDENKTFLLREGTTKIGRHKQADIITISDICSRTHCFIKNNNNQITVEDNNSSNGVYVNGERITSMQLNTNDTIGLGCTEAVIEESEDKTKFYIFKLLKVSAVTDSPITVADSDCEDDLFADQGESDAEIVFCNNSNEGACITGADVAEANNNAEPIIEEASNADPTNMENDDDIELQYSQQCFKVIKQEVEDSFSMEAFQEDIIIHDDDNEDVDEADDQLEIPLSQWSTLSQNQDFVVKKVEASKENKKRKAVKVIEPLPEVPKRRRKSASIADRTVAHDRREKPKQSKQIVIDMAAAEPIKKSAMPPSAKDSKKAKVVEESVLEVLVTASTSKMIAENAVPSTSKHNQKSVGSEHNEIGTMRKRPRRIAHAPKDHTTYILKSILKTSQSSKKCQEAEFHTFERREYEEQVILISPHAQKREQREHFMSNRSHQSFENESLDRIINEITEWSPSWLPQKATPQIFPNDFIVAPLMDDYPSIELYHSIIIPLLKYELWASIQAEDISKTVYEVSIDSTRLVPKADGKRHLLFVTQLNPANGYNRMGVGTFAVVALNGKRFFAYLSQMNFPRNEPGQRIGFILEVSEKVRLDKVEGLKCSVTPISNIRTELKIFNAIFHLGTSPLKHLILSPRSYQHPEIPAIKFKYCGYGDLNTEQRCVVETVYRNCLHSSTNLTMIEGPPGTGKTRVIVSMISQLLYGKELESRLKRVLKILVLATSNAAVDIITRRLLYAQERTEITNGNKRNIVRYGVLSSMHPDVRRIAPESLAQQKRMKSMSDNEHLNSLIRERDRLTKSIEEEKLMANSRSTVLGDKIDDFKKRLKHANDAIAKRTATNSISAIDMKQTLSHAHVVCSTVSSAINLKQFVRSFDVCFLDEASQCTEAWSLVPLQYDISSYILVGDSNQLSPVVLSKVCRQNFMERSLFTRIFEMFNYSKQNGQLRNAISLSKQYRMHPEICSFPNKYFYGGRLESVNTISQRFTLTPYNIFTLDCNQTNTDSVNYYNEYEAEFIINLLKVMIKHADPKKYSYGIISPYSQQTACIKNLLRASKTLSRFAFPVNTIDSYQGQEKDIIIFSITRTSGVGFLANSPRLNVALTRARRSLVICGNFSSLLNVRVWKELLNDANQRDKIHPIPRKYEFDLIAKYLVIAKQNCRQEEK